MAKPKMISPELWESAGIDPKTGLPTRTGTTEESLKKSIRKMLTVMDEQDAVTRYTWYNLPGGITSQELERLLYLKGQLVLFYLNGKYWFMPYALSGGLDYYGRYKAVHPVPISNTGGDKTQKAQKDYLEDIKLEIVYEIPQDAKKFEDIVMHPEKYGFLLYDYSKQLSQTTTPRSSLQKGILDLMSSIIPFSKTALASSTGVRGIRVPNEDEYTEVLNANNQIVNAAENCRPFIPIVGALEFQDISSGSVGNIQDFLIALQSYDNFRLSAYGLDTGGLFDKKAYVNKEQNEMNVAGRSTSPLTDGLLIRQHLCDLFNAFTGWGMWVEVSEIAAGGDLDGDGLVGDSDVENVTVTEQEDTNDEE